MNCASACFCLNSISSNCFAAIRVLRHMNISRTIGSIKRNIFCETHQNPCRKSASPADLKIRAILFVPLKRLRGLRPCNFGKRQSDLLRSIFVCRSPCNIAERFVKMRQVAESALPCNFGNRQRGCLEQFHAFCNTETAEIYGIRNAESFPKEG